MTPMAHRVAPCPGCATCERNVRRERLIAALVLLVFVAVFVLRIAVPG